MDMKGWVSVLEKHFFPDLGALAGYMEEDRRVLVHRDAFIDVFQCLRRHPAHETFHVEAFAINPGPTTDMHDLSARANAYLRCHREAAMACIARALNRSGVAALPIQGGIELGNGRTLSVDGYWFVFGSNYYRRVSDPDLLTLLTAEMLLISQVLHVACAFAGWIGENRPDEDQLNSVEPWARPVKFEADPRVSRFRDERVTLLMRGLTEAAQANFHHAQHLVLDSEESSVPKADMGQGGEMGKTVH